jgi:glycosyltransferase involved in cell wall biosynthesis
MKIVQVNVVYQKGSTGKIVYDLHTMLQENGNESIVCYGRKKMDSKKGIYKISSELEAKLHAIYARISGYTFTGSFFATLKLIRLLKKEKPDIVHLHCLNGYFINIYKLLNFLKVNKFPTVLTLHAEFMHTGGCGHAYDCERWKIGCGNCPQLRDATHSLFFDNTAEQWRMMKKTFENFERLKVVAVSKWLGDRAKISPILSDKEIYVVGNGIDTENIFMPLNSNELKKKHNLTDEKIVLYVSPSFISVSKGGHFVIKLAKKMQNKNVKFIVVGFDGDESTLPNNIIGVRHTKNQSELAKYYSMADITVLTSKRETFSMVCAESLACGTPVIGFEAGAPEEIALKDFSEFVVYGDIDALGSILLKWLKRDKDNFHELRKCAQQEYSRKVMFSKYMAIYNEFNTR